MSQRYGYLVVIDTTLANVPAVRAILADRLERDGARDVDVVDVQAKPAPGEVIVPCKFCGKELIDHCRMIKAIVPIAVPSPRRQVLTAGAPIEVSLTDVEKIWPLQPVQCPHCKALLGPVRKPGAGPTANGESEIVLPGAPLPGDGGV